MKWKHCWGAVAAGAVLASLLVGAIGGCGQAGRCEEETSSPEVVAGEQVSPVQGSTAAYVGSGDPYTPGPLSIRRIQLDACDYGSPQPLLIFAPVSPAAYPVVVFQHGFLGKNSDYGELLRHLAGHGFVVVAPQMYAGLGVAFGNPRPPEEARRAARVLGWLPVGLPAALGYVPDVRRLGLAGHSRGGQVCWLLLAARPSRVLAAAAIDPVDGAEPRGNRTWAAEEPLSFSGPALVIGTGLGGRCAPAGQNHEQFYAVCRSPAWHVVVPHQGHTDMLNEGPAMLGRLMCDGGPDRAGMRRLTAGLLVALFRSALQGDESAYAYLSDPSSAVLEVVVERR